MVWIHGVDFTYGSCKFRDMQPDYFMDKDIIIVTVSYRLGVLGKNSYNHICTRENVSFFVTPEKVSHLKSA